MSLFKRLFRYNELEIEKLYREVEEQRQNAVALEKGMDELQESYEMQILSYQEKIEHLETSVQALLNENARLQDEILEIKRDA